MKRALIALWVAAVLAAPGAAYAMHRAAQPQQAVQATWQQEVVTTSDEGVFNLAQHWDTPFVVAYVIADADADIVVTYKPLADMAGGEATREEVDGRIIGCTISAESTIDSKDRRAATALLHELGHCFGLHHTNDDADALMYWVQGGKSGSVWITPDDQAALSRLYTTGAQ